MRGASVRSEQVKVLDSPAALAEAAAEEVVRIGRQAQLARSTFSLVLSGGSTPRALHARLAGPRRRGRLSWSEVDLFWGDERCVPPNHPQSNYRMAEETLLRGLPEGAAIHRIQGEIAPARAAAAYESRLREVTGEALPSLDLVLLGIGGDGHTASLFPATPDIDGGRRLTIATKSPQPPHDRISLTLRAINAARNVLFLVQGADKAPMLARLLAPRKAEDRALPAARVRPRDGRLLWMLDRAAAAALSHGRHT